MVLMSPAPAPVVIFALVMSWIVPVTLLGIVVALALRKLLRGLRKLERNGFTRIGRTSKMPPRENEVSRAAREWLERDIPEMRQPSAREIQRLSDNEPIADPYTGIRETPIEELESPSVWVDPDPPEVITPPTVQRPIFDEANFAYEERYYAALERIRREHAITRRRIVDPEVNRPRTTTWFYPEFYQHHGTRSGRMQGQNITHAVVDETQQHRHRPNKSFYVGGPKHGDPVQPSELEMDTVRVASYQEIQLWQESYTIPIDQTYHDYKKRSVVVMFGSKRRTIELWVLSTIEDPDAAVFDFILHPFEQ